MRLAIRTYQAVLLQAVACLEVSAALDAFERLLLFVNMLVAFQSLWSRKCLAAICASERTETFRFGVDLSVEI